MTPSYSDVRFYAEKTRKNGKFTGTVIIVDPKKKNGACVAAIGRPTDGRPYLPTVTWVSPRYLKDRCVRVSEARAREIDPLTFKYVDSYEKGSKDYRTMYAIEAKTPLQSL